MALTIAAQRVWAAGSVKLATIDVTFDSSYPDNGESLTGADLGMDILLDFVSDGFAMKSDGTLGVMTKYDYANSKLLAFKSNTAANPQEVGDTASLDTYKVRLLILGKGKATGTAY
jgi:hypothetical protein